MTEGYLRIDPSCKQGDWMDFKPKSYEKIRQLIDKGVDIRNPGTLDIGDEVNVNHISSQGC
ncbi:MAG: hypothetical protein MZV70_09840 [Desulfobacterales bacterium]|nr:hypothetical protein [Desulfobacterales bacterium]